MKIQNLIVSAAAFLGVSRAGRWIEPNDSWVVAVNGSPSDPFNAQLTSWAPRCVTEEDRATVEAKCETYKGDMEGYMFRDFVEDCVQKYCDMVEVRTVCRKKCLPGSCNKWPLKECQAATFPGTREACEADNFYVDKPCKRYRLGWSLGGSEDVPTSEGKASLVPRLLKLKGRSSETKWLLLPYLGFQSESVPMEYQETDLWIPEMLEIFEAYLYFDTHGSYSKLKESPTRFHVRFHASFLRVIPVEGDIVTDIGFSRSCDSYASCKAATILTRRKWYDLASPVTVCSGNPVLKTGYGNPAGDGSPLLCEWSEEDFNYGKSVPSWRERKEMVIVNTLRTDMTLALTRLFDMTYDEATEIRRQCKSPDGTWPSNDAPPFYYNLAACEGTRLRAYELAKNTTYVPSREGLSFNGTDIYSRVEAHTGGTCHLADGCGPVDWPVAASGGQKTSRTGTVGVVGEVPFLGNCDRFRALMDPHRSMAAVGFYPSAEWDVDHPTEGYAGPVHMFFGGDHSNQAYSSEYFLTYQPIPSGTHMLIDNEPNKIRFMAQYYATRPHPDDTSRLRLKAHSFEVVVDGVPYPLEYFSDNQPILSDDTLLRTYTVDVEDPGSDHGCLSYYFRATNDRGIFTLPQSGKYVFTTYGWKGCVESIAPAGKEVAGDFGSACGYPGKRCPPTESDCKAAGFDKRACLNAGCSYHVEMRVCTRNTDFYDGLYVDESSRGCRFSVLASFIVSLVVALM